MKNYWNQTSEEVLKGLGVLGYGLSQEEVETRRLKHGFNALNEEEKDGLLKVFFSQFKDLLVIILIASAVLSAAFGKVESAVVIVMVLMLNAVLGTMQHVKAERSMEGLRKLSSPSVKAIRDGRMQVLPSREVVPGDILLLEAGDMVSADGRLIESMGLIVMESSLTGEAEGVLKISEAIDEVEVPIGDRVNMVHSGSFVVKGRGTMVVTATGMATELGKIAGLLSGTGDKRTPLQKDLDDFSKKLASGIMVLTTLILISDVLRGKPLMEALLFGVSLAVAAIPEALSTIVTVVLSIGTGRMAEEKAVIRDLHSVEVLGGVSVICTDKTGTLTQNRMTVTDAFVDGNLIEAKALDIDDDLSRDLVAAGLLCSDAVTRGEESFGDPTETALVDLGELYGMDEELARSKHTRLSELPFDSDRKLMSTLVDYKGKNVMFMKGAPEVVLSRTTKIRTSEGVRLFDEASRQSVLETVEELSIQGKRVLAFSEKIMDKDDIVDSDESNMTFIGLIALMDPPRPEVHEAIRTAADAGIRTVMITGDHKSTASAIASKLGILRDGDVVLEGRDLDHMTDEGLEYMVEKTSVYARVSPEHKIRIVKAWQDKGKVVAMTGDGVNDAPALKRSDIGVAMGITGTEVAKDASSMVLSDDNFGTIVKAVASGRGIYENIRNAIRFLLSGNTSGILAVLLASLAGLPAPFMPVHLLFINLVTDSLPAIAIGMEKPEPGLMSKPPRDIDAHILDKGFIRSVAIDGTIMALAVMASYVTGLKTGNSNIAATMAFLTLGLSRLLHGISSRTAGSFLKSAGTRNHVLAGSVIMGFALFYIIFNVPVLRGVFEVASIPTGYSIFAVGMAFVSFILVQTVRIIETHIPLKEGETTA
jgi:Ca2+-transporting ATPase